MGLSGSGTRQTLLSSVDNPTQLHISDTHFRLPSSLVLILLLHFVIPFLAVVKLGLRNPGMSSLPTLQGISVLADLANEYLEATWDPDQPLRRWLRAMKHLAIE